MIRRLALAAAVTLVSTPALATSYTLDPNHTEGVFRWSHLGFSNPSAQFSHVEGTLEFDPADPARSSVRVTIPIARVDSGVAALNVRLRDIEFFDLARFPTASFNSTRVEKGSAPGRFKVSGDFSLHGVTRPITLDVTLNKIGANPLAANLAEIGFEASTTIRRSDYGMGLYAPQIVSDEIRVEITSEAVESKAFLQELKDDAEQKAAAAREAAEKAAAAEGALKK